MKSDPETAQEPTPWEKFVELARKVVADAEGGSGQAGARLAC